MKNNLSAPVSNEFDASDFGIGLEEVAIWQFQVV
jgi:hypothetical protein